MEGTSDPRNSDGECLLPNLRQSAEKLGTRIRQPFGTGSAPFSEPQENQQLTSPYVLWRIGKPSAFSVAIMITTTEVTANKTNLPAALRTNEQPATNVSDQREVQLKADCTLPEFPALSPDHIYFAIELA